MAEAAIKSGSIYLLGYPLTHSVSPPMQNAALRACGARGVRYETLALPAEKMDAMIDALRAENCLGANVTIPHKQTIMSRLDDLSDTARAIGAVNTIVKRDGKLIGENSDAYGFLEALRARQIQPRRSHALILGAGGAARAAAYALASAGARQLVLINRTSARAAELADHLYAQFPELELAVNDWDALPRMNFIINATAIGMTPHADESPLPPGRPIPRGAVVFDLVYNPPATRLIKEAKKAGARWIGGLEMLIYQGARAFELWTGEPAPLPVMRAAAQRALDKQNRPRVPTRKGPV